MLRTLKILRIADRCLQWLLVTLLLAGAAGLGLLKLHGTQLLSVQTASMVPAFKPGDGLVVVPAKPVELRTGEVISYHNPDDPRMVISHRLVSIYKDNLTTAGDALGSKDHAFSSSLLIGRAEAVLPRFGYVLQSLRHPISLIALVYLPALYITGKETRRLFISFTAVKYRLLEYNR